MVKLYVLGDRFDVRGFRADCIDALRGSLENQNITLGRLLIWYIYQNTHESSMLRRLAIHKMTYGVSFHNPASWWEDLPDEFLAAVMVTIGRRSPGNLCDSCYNSALRGNHNKDLEIDDVDQHEDIAPYYADICFYHEHTDVKEREACRASRDNNTSGNK